MFSSRLLTTALHATRGTCLSGSVSSGFRQYVVVVSLPLRLGLPRGGFPVGCTDDAWLKILQHSAIHVQRDNVTDEPSVDPLASGMVWASVGRKDIANRS